MAKTVRSWTLKEIAGAVGGTASGEAEITRPVPAGYDDPNGITFAGSASYLEKALGSTVGAIIVPAETPEIDRPTIRVADPRMAFGMVLGMMARPLPLNKGIHATAVISEGARVDDRAQIGPYAVIEDGALVGPWAKVYSHCYVGENCSVGEKCVLYPGVVLYQDVRVGTGSILHSGVVLGADGFGFVWTGEGRMKIPQVGGVVLGEQVEIGANTCVDRATSGETVIGKGVKLDNLVQVAHNVEIGDHTVLAAHVGIAGSSTLGARVVMGGQAGMADHLSVGDDVVLGGRSGVISNISEPGEYMGFPPVPAASAMRSVALQQRLPELFKRLRDLEKKVKELSGE